MPRNAIRVALPPEAIWAVLADARSYGSWVVGASDIRGQEGAWPEPGATFHHTQGPRFLPVRVKDTTTSLVAEPRRRLVMVVRVRPWLVANVELGLAPDGEGGTRVEMLETPVGGLLRPLAPLLEVLIHQRNAITLRRLARLAAQRHAAAPSVPAAG